MARTRTGEIAALPAIDSVSAGGFKSLVEETGPVEIRNLTLLAGANSSGKSTLLQPALLLKQTLESGYDPGPLLLHGSHVRFSSPEELLARRRGQTAKSFSVAIGFTPEWACRCVFGRVRHGFEVEETSFRLGAASMTLEPGLSADELIRRLEKTGNIRHSVIPPWVVNRKRCFLTLGVEEPAIAFGPAFLSTRPFEEALLRIIHVPGIRGNPERAHPTTAGGPLFPGTFEKYVATLIHLWQEGRLDQLDRLRDQLGTLGLTQNIVAERLDANRIELKVDRLPYRTKRRDLVNIADVGFGVSQILPVLVALLVAEPGRLVYLEQPEIHLHPKAQVALASILVEAANRGVRVVVETHSELLLLTLQTLVAEGSIDPQNVRLHWFEREADGSSKITTAELDADGSYGDWPEDFGSVSLGAERRYLDAVDSLARS